MSLKLTNLKKLTLGVILWLSLLGTIVAITTLPITTNKAVDIDFLPAKDDTKALIFFGFNGCSDVCPTTLAILRDLLLLEEDQSQWPQLLFIDIDQTSSSQNANDYAQQFHPHIKGYQPSQGEFASLVRQFGLTIEQKDKRIDHLGRLYLLHKKSQSWFLVKTYNASTYSAKTLKNELF